MSVVSTGQQPFNNLAHDEHLAMKICEGARPGFSNNTPKFYIELAFRCMDANPDKRPTAKEIYDCFNKYNKFNNKSFNIIFYLLFIKKKFYFFLPKSFLLCWCTCYSEFVTFG